MARVPRRLLFGVALCAAVVVPLAVGEVLVRRFHPDYRLGRSLLYDPVIFARHLFSKGPHVATLWGKVSWPINAQGYRGEQDLAPRTPGVRRVVIIGGSSVFDILTSGEDDWPHQVGRLLAKKGRPTEVINAGIPGHASCDAVGRMYSEIGTLQPDYVVLYACWNDLKYFNELADGEPLIRVHRPLENDIDIFAECSGGVDCWFGERSRLYVLARTRYLTWYYDMGPEGVVEERSESRDTVGEAGPRQYRLNVALFVEAARGISATPVLTTEVRLPTADNGDRGLPISYEYVGMTHRALVEALGTCDAAVRDVGREKGVPVIDLSSRFSGRKELLSDHVHLSPQGSGEVAAAVADYLLYLFSLEATTP